MASRYSSRSATAKKAEEKSYGLSPERRSSRQKFTQTNYVTSDSESDGEVWDSDDCIVIEDDQDGSPPSSMETSSPREASEEVEFLMERAVIEEDVVVVVAPTQMKSLPVEVHHLIIDFLDTDRDVIHYGQMSKDAYASINDHVWFKRFIRTFDFIDEMGPTKLAALYKERARVTKELTVFDLHLYCKTNPYARVVQQPRQPVTLAMIKSLILESNATIGRDKNGDIMIQANNYEFIREWCLQKGDDGQHLDILDSMMVTEGTSWNPEDIVSAETKNAEVLVIQLCLAPLFLDYDVIVDRFNEFHTSQAEAYTDHVSQPMFVGFWKQDINVRWMLSTINFIGFHLKQTCGEGVLNHEYWALPKTQKTLPWLGKLEDGTKPVGQHWKGAYTYMDAPDLSYHRREGGDIPVDNYEPLQDIALFFNEAQFSSDAWPRSFESLVQTDPYEGEPKDSPQPSRRTRSSGTLPPSPKKYPLKSFYGSCDSDNSHFFGRIHGLPPQQGIPGFQRISAVRFSPSEEDHESFDSQQIWGYEGCVLPGGRIIVGRWWHITPGFEPEPIDRYSGPFVWWNIDECAADPPLDPQDTINFLNILKDTGFGS